MDRSHLRRVESVAETHFFAGPAVGLHGRPIHYLATSGGSYTERTGLGLLLSSGL